MSNKNAFDYDPLGEDVGFAVGKENNDLPQPMVDTKPQIEATAKRGRGRPPKTPKPENQQNTTPAATASTTAAPVVKDNKGAKDPVALLLNYIGSQIVTVTPTFASHVLGHCNGLNRKLNKRWIKFLADAITRGEWQLNGEPIIFSSDYQLIDGQHRLHAVVAANKPIDTYVTTGVDAKTFMSVDTGHSRSGSHVLEINSKIKHSNKKMKHTFDVSATLNKLSRFHNKNYDFDGAHVISNRQLISLQEKHKHIADSVEYVRKFPKGYSKSTIAFCHYVMSQIDKELAATFFEQLANPTPTIPLIAALRKATIKEGKAKSRIKQTVVIGSIFKTWNAMRTNDVNANPAMTATEEFPIPA